MTGELLSIDKRNLQSAIKKYQEKLRLEQVSGIEMQALDACLSVMDEEYNEENLKNLSEDINKMAKEELGIIVRYINKTIEIMRRVDEYYNQVVIDFKRKIEYGSYSRMPDIREDALGQYYYYRFCEIVMGLGDEIDNQDNCEVSLPSIDAKFLGKEFYNKICFAAVNKDGHALEFVEPEHLPEDKAEYARICRAAVNMDGCALEFVKPEHLPEDKKAEYAKICRAAVNEDSHALEFVKPEHLPEDKAEYDKICRAAVNVDSHALEFVKFEHLPEDKKAGYAMICHDLIQSNGSALGWMPEQYRSIELCMVAYESDVSALKYFPQEVLNSIAKDRDLATKIIQRNYYAKDILRGHNNDIPNLIDSIATELMKTCKIIVLQSKSSDGELEDIGTIYTDKKDKAKGFKGLWVRTPEELMNLLDEIEKEQDTDHKVNIALVGHASLKAKTMVDMKPKDIAKLAYGHPCIEKVTFLGCMSGASKKKVRLTEEQKNQEELEQKINQTASELEEKYPFLKNKKRSEKLARDIVVGSALTPCGIGLIKGPVDFTKLTLPEKLDTAYVFIETDGHYAVHYLQRTLEGISHREVIEKLDELQRVSLVELGLTSMKLTVTNEPILNKQGEQVFDRKTNKPIMRINKERVNLFSPNMELTNEPCWMINKKGEIGSLDDNILVDMHEFIPDFRARPFVERPYQKTPEKPSFARKTTIDYDDNQEDFAKIEGSLVGRTCKEYKNLLDKNKTSHTSVIFEGTRGLLTPFTSIHTKDTGRLNITKNAEPWKNDLYSKHRFFGRDTHNVDTDELARQQRKLLKEGYLKMVGVKMK